MKTARLVAAALLVAFSAQASDYTTLNLGLNKTTNPDRIGAFIDGVWTDLLKVGNGVVDFVIPTQHVPTNAALAASTIAQFSGGAWRDDYSSGFGAPPLFFTTQLGSCASNSMVNDGGSCVDASDGNSFKAVHPSGIYNVLQFGASNVGVIDASPAINAAVVAASAGNGSVFVPCGTYKVGSTIAARTKMDIGGAGSCTLIKPGTSFTPDTRIGSIYGAATSARYIFSNDDMAAGNTDIRIHDLTVDTTSLPASAPNYAILMGKVSRVEIDHIRFIGVSVSSFGATAFLGQSSHYRVHDNYATGMGTTCYDNWDGPSYVQITDNFCDGGGVALNAVLVNGISPLVTGTPIGRTASHVIVSRNKLYNTKAATINVSGLCHLGTCGRISDAIITDNIVDTGLGNGIYIGDGDDFTVANNYVANTATDGIRVASQIAGGVTSNVVILPGVIKNAVTSGNGASITIGSSGDVPTNILIDGGVISGSTHQWPVHVWNGTVGVVVKKGSWDIGTAGSSAIGGTDTLLLSPPQVERTLVGFSKTADTTLADVPGLSFKIEKGRVYRLSGSLAEAQAATGGQKYALGGTATFSSVSVRGKINCNTVTATRQYTGANITALGGTVAEVSTSCGSSTVTFDGLLVASTSGTLTIQFAQQTSDPVSSTVLAGALFELAETL